jgi:hypothetical protein
MFIATGHLALRATATPWRLYARTQASALLTAAVTCFVALSTRLALEAAGASSAIITLAVLAAAAVPWSLSMLRALGDPDFELLRGGLPRWGVRLIETAERRRH